MFHDKSYKDYKAEIDKFSRVILTPLTLSQAYKAITKHFDLFSQEYGCSICGLIQDMEFPEGPVQTAKWWPFLNEKGLAYDTNIDVVNYCGKKYILASNMKRKWTYADVLICFLNYAFNKKPKEFTFAPEVVLMVTANSLLPVTDVEIIKFVKEKRNLVLNTSTVIPQKRDGTMFHPDEELEGTIKFDYSFWRDAVGHKDRFKSPRSYRCNCCGKCGDRNSGFQVRGYNLHFCSDCSVPVFHEPEYRSKSVRVIYTPMK